MASTSLPGAGLLGDDVMIETSDGRALRAMVAGHGDDLVVLESGLGVSGIYWKSVHERVAGRTRVVAYERAGFGGSEPDPRARTLARLADDLETIVAGFPHERLVLVGHSWGGPIAREVAARRIRRGEPMTGLVLVDQSDENAAAYFTGTARRQFAASAALLVPLARLGLLAPLTRRMIAPLSGRLRDAVIAASCSPRAARAAAAEQRRVIGELSEVRRSPPILGDLPIRVVSGTYGGRLQRRVRASIVDAHRATARAHVGAQFVSASRSGHLVPITEPDLVAAVVIELLDPVVGA